MVDEYHVSGKFDLYLENNCIPIWQSYMFKQ